MLVTVHHARRAGYCIKGCRAFAQRYGLDWRQFVRQGIDAEKLESTGDAMAKKAVEIARGR
jgi:hypothetical protein